MKLKWKLIAFLYMSNSHLEAIVEEKFLFTIGE